MSMHVLLLHPYEVLYCSAHARVHNEILTPSPPQSSRRPKDSTRLEGGKQRSWRQNTWVGGVKWLTCAELVHDWPATRC